jgi:hypothetical protein
MRQLGAHQHLGIVGGTRLREQLEGVELSLAVPGEQPAGKGKDRGETEKDREETKEKERSEI